jgi:hypothetical protein
MGIGRCLLAAILAQARLDEVAQISLSVETDNPARRLYEPFGFRDLESVDGAVTMIATLPNELRRPTANPTSPMGGWAVSSRVGGAHSHGNGAWRIVAATTALQPALRQRRGRP